jgi:glycosyltransferase involved in cell wall biosynthesis
MPPVSSSDPGSTVGPVVMLGVGWFPDERGGLNRYLFELLRASPEVAETRAVVLGPAADRPPNVRVAGPADDPLPLRLIRYAKAAHDEVDGAALVDGHFALLTAAALTRRSVRALPLVVHFQGPWAAESKAARTSGPVGVWAKRLLERLVYRRADGLVVLSAAFKRILVGQYGIVPWRVHVIAPGVDLEHFTPGDRMEARQSLDLAPDAFVAVTTRRLVHRTGVDVLVDAWSRLDRGDARLLIAGTGPEAGPLREQVERLELDGSVRFLGEVSDADVVRLYQAADLSVVPSRALEGFGLVVLESLACGTPVLGSDAGGLGEAIALVDPGLIVHADDPDALAERLGRAIADPGDLPDRARCRTAAEAHRWAGVAATHTRLYQDVVHPTVRSKRRVVYLDHTAQLSGAEVALARMLPALDGVEPHVILAADGPLATRLARAGCSVELLPLAEGARSLSRSAVSDRGLPVWPVLTTAAHVLRLARRLRQLAPDIVHTNSLKSALYGGLAARLAGIPVVWQVNDRVAVDYLSRSGVRLIRAAAARLPDHIIVNSAATSATLPDSRPVTVIPPMIPPAPARAKRAVGPGPGGLRIGIVGRLSPWKGQDLFLQAFAAAFPDGGATAVIVGAALFGEDEVEPGLRALAEDLGVGDRVELLGHRNDVTEVMAGIDILVHASVIPEPFGMVVAEGMALGLPVVAADAGGPAEIINDGVDGLLYPMADASALADRLQRLASDDGLRQRLGEGGRARSALFAPDVVAPAVQAVYSAVLDARSGRWRSRSKANRCGAF